MSDKPFEDLTEDVVASIEVGDIPILWGLPGTGKTSFVSAIARRMDLPLHTLIGSLCDPTDINGFPVVSDTRVEDAHGRAHPVLEFAPRRWLVEMSKTGGILFFDELTSCPPAVQAALLRSMLDKVFGDFPLDPHKVAIVAAANGADVAVNGQELGAPMVNRISHYQFPMGSAAALEWAGNFASYWGSPRPVRFGRAEVSEASMLRARSFVAGFIRRFPDQWHSMPGEQTPDDANTAAGKKTKKAVQQDDGQSGWPSPRSWDRVSWHIGRCIENDIPPTEALRRVSAAVGTAAAAAFTAYMRETSIPDPEVLLAKPDAFEPSGRPDLDFSTLAAVAAAVEAKTDSGRYKNAWVILSRAFGGGGNKTGNLAYEAAAPAARRLLTLMHPDSADRVRKGLQNKEVPSYLLDIQKLAAPFDKLMKAMSIKI